MHRSLSFAMQRVLLRTNRFWRATNRAADVALNNLATHADRNR